MGDPVKGKTLFVRMCSMCHTVGKNEKHRVGPNLFGIFGKTCGSTYIINIYIYIFLFFLSFFFIYFVYFRERNKYIGIRVYTSIVYGLLIPATAGFNYTDAMKNKNIVWNESTLDEYLRLPKDFVPGTRMVFTGIKKADERKDVIAYLATLK